MWKSINPNSVSNIELPESLKPYQLFSQLVENNRTQSFKKRAKHFLRNRESFKHIEYSRIPPEVLVQIARLNPTFINEIEFRQIISIPKAARLLVRSGFLSHEYLKKLFSFLKDNDMYAQECDILRFAWDSLPDPQKWRSKINSYFAEHQLDPFLCLPKPERDYLRNNGFHSGTVRSALRNDNVDMLILISQKQGFDAAKNTCPQETPHDEYEDDLPDDNFLNIAAYYGSYNCCQWLLEVGAKPLPNVIPFVLRTGSKELVQLFEEKGVDFSHSLKDALKSGNYELFDYLVSKSDKATLKEAFVESAKVSEPAFFIWFLNSGMNISKVDTINTVFALYLINERNIFLAINRFVGLFSKAIVVAIIGSLVDGKKAVDRNDLYKMDLIKANDSVEIMQVMFENGARIPWKYAEKDIQMFNKKDQKKILKMYETQKPRKIREDENSETEYSYTCSDSDDSNSKGEEEEDDSNTTSTKESSNSKSSKDNTNNSNKENEKKVKNKDDESTTEPSTNTTSTNSVAKRNQTIVNDKQIYFPPPPVFKEKARSNRRRKRKSVWSLENGAQEYEYYSDDEVIKPKKEQAPRKEKEKEDGGCCRL